MRLAPSLCACGATAVLLAFATAPNAFAADQYRGYDASDQGRLDNGSLPRAIQDIEQSTGGRVLEARLLHEHGPGFLAVVSRGHELINVRYTEPTRHTTVLKVQETPRWMLDWQLRQDMRDIRRTTLSTADAVRKVERATQAPATDIELARPLSGTNAVLAYQVEVLKDGRPERSAIDANTGQLISDPESLFSPWTPERLARQDEKKHAEQR